MRKQSSTEYGTPQQFFDTLNNEFHFTLDACASAENAKCEKFYSKHEDSLDRDWSKDIVWMNPPYNGEISKWMKKAYTEAQKGATVVCLIQSRSTDSKMWHSYVMKASEWRFVADRLHFSLNGRSARANISSVVVIFKPYYQDRPYPGVIKVSSINTRGEPLN